MSALPKGWTTVALGDVTSKAPKWDPRSSGKLIDYIDIASIDTDAKRIVSTKQVHGADAPSRARQLVHTNDVLVSTVRPNLNGVSLVPPNLDGATASTGFSVLRATPDLEPRFLGHWVSTRDFVSQLVQQASGQSYPAVSDKIVRETKLPLPPLNEQRRIAAILDNAAQTVQHVTEALKLSADIRRTLASEIDGRQESQFQRLRDAGVTLVSGKSVTGVEDSWSNGRVIKTSAVSSGTFDASESKPLPRDYTPPDNHRVREGDLLFTRASGSVDLIGVTTFVPPVKEDLYLPDKVWRVEINPKASIHPQYLHASLLTARFRAFVENEASGASGVRNISKRKVSDYMIPIPPKDAQAKVAVVLQALTKFDDLHRARRRKAHSLYSSLQARAFRGEL